MAELVVGSERLTARPGRGQQSGQATLIDTRRCPLDRPIPEFRCREAGCVGTAHAPGQR